MKINKELEGRLSDIALEAVGHFMLGWGEDAAPSILNPWKHRITEDRSLDLYPDFSEIIMDNEMALGAMLRGGEIDCAVIEEINSRCEKLAALF